MEAKNSQPQSDPILPSFVILAPLQWNLMEEIRRAHAKDAPPSTCPATKLYVPITLHLTAVLQLVHKVPSSGHPGIRCTMELTLRCFWWPSLCSDVVDYVRSCATCVQSRTSRQLPEGLLKPLPIPHCPWSHIAVDFLTALLASNGFTTILVVINRFSKACKLVALKGLPTAMETVTRLFHQVFCHYGLLEDIVSDRDPQFTSHVWWAFCFQLGINVSLSSGYHPQPKQKD